MFAKHPMSEILVVANLCIRTLFLHFMCRHIGWAIRCWWCGMVGNCELL